MSLEHWLAFVAASAVLLAIPGPTILLVISYALGHGRKAAPASVAGVALGDFTAMTASMLGLGVLLATSAMLFTILKWVGAAYLVYLGYKLWRAPVDTAEMGEETQTRSGRIFLHLYAVTALNPKSIVFFVAFLPQFLDASAPLLPHPGHGSDVPGAGHAQCAALRIDGDDGAAHHSQTVSAARRQ